MMHSHMDGYTYSTNTKFASSVARKLWRSEALSTRCYNGRVEFLSTVWSFPTCAGIGWNWASMIMYGQFSAKSRFRSNFVVVGGN